MNANIEIVNIEQSETLALIKAVERVTAYACEKLVKATIYVEPRVPIDAPDYKHPGWLEYGLNIETTNGRIFIAMIQRKVGDQFEFHS